MLACSHLTQAVSHAAKEPAISPADVMPITQAFYVHAMCYSCLIQPAHGTPDSTLALDQARFSCTFVQQQGCKAVVRSGSALQITNESSHHGLSALSQIQPLGSLAVRVGTGWQRMVPVMSHRMSHQTMAPGLFASCIWAALWLSKMGRSGAARARGWAAFSPLGLDWKNCTHTPAHEPAEICRSAFPKCWCPGLGTSLQA